MRLMYSVLLITVLLFSCACSSQSNGVVESFEKEVTEEFGAEVFIPEIEEYPITTVEIQSPPVGDRSDLLVQYSNEKGELKSEEYIKKYEENMNSEILYGIHGDGTWLFRIRYNSSPTSSTPSESKTINGIDVQYHEAEIGKGVTALLVTFNIEGGSYHIEFSLRDGLTKEKAFEIIEIITKEVN